MSDQGDTIKRNELAGRWAALSTVAKVTGRPEAVLRRWARDGVIKALKYPPGSDEDKRDWIIEIDDLIRVLKTKRLLPPMTTVTALFTGAAVMSFIPVVGPMMAAAAGVAGVVGAVGAVGAASTLAAGKGLEAISPEQLVSLNQAALTGSIDISEVLDMLLAKDKEIQRLRVQVKMLEVENRTLREQLGSGTSEEQEGT